ncbi:DUF2510 domain-containing protein [Microlunatus speluncae]|uniref:DUF2510 domain-containing protein n=1 Tax=Microlunatus speluncae TaxID=2594267 RepID=UPI00126624C4|nr:DUF2510 domain-containing protein [Microlunatus speluncae]
MTDRPGWYADPSGRNETYRWWDGAAWTRWLSEDEDAPTPDQPGPSDPARGDVFVAEPDQDQPAIRLPLAIGITIVAVALAIILLGVSVSLTEDQLPAGPAIDPPAKKDQPVVALYDQTVPGYVAGTVKMKLPGAPYDCSDYATTLRSGAPDGFRCDFAVHEDYRPKYSWMADTGFGVLPDTMVVPDDLKATCQKVLNQLGTNGYEGVKLLNPKFKAEPLTGITNPPDEAMKVTGTFGYRVPNLPSTSGNLEFVVIKLKDSGKHVVFYVDYPNDAPREIVAASKAVFETLTAR